MSLPQFHRCWEKTRGPWWETKDFIVTHSTAGKVSLVIVRAPPANQVICRHCTHSVFVLQLRNHKLGKPRYLKGLLATLSNLFPTGEYYLYYHDIIPIFQGCLLRKHPSKHRQKLSQMCRNTMDNWPQEVFYSLPSDPLSKGPS